MENLSLDEQIEKNKKLQAIESVRFDSSIRESEQKLINALDENKSKEEIKKLEEDILSITKQKEESLSNLIKSEKLLLNQRKDSDKLESLRLQVKYDSESGEREEAEKWDSRRKSTMEALTDPKAWLLNFLKKQALDRLEYAISKKKRMDVAKENEEKVEKKKKSDNEMLDRENEYRNAIIERSEIQSLSTEERSEIQSLSTEERSEIQSIPTEERNEIQSIPTEERNEIQSIPTEERNEILSSTQLSVPPSTEEVFVSLGYDDKLDTIISLLEESNETQLKLGKSDQLIANKQLRQDKDQWKADQRISAKEEAAAGIGKKLGGLKGIKGLGGFGKKGKGKEGEEEGGFFSNMLSELGGDIIGNALGNKFGKGKGLLGKGKGLLGKGKGILPKGLGMLKHIPKFGMGMGGMGTALASGGSAVASGGSALATGAAGMASSAMSGIGAFAAANPIGAAVLATAAIGAGAYMLWDSMRGSDEAKEAFDAAEDAGLVDHDVIGDSEILDWEGIKKLSPKAIDGLIEYDDWSNEDMKRLKEIKETGDFDDGSKKKKKKEEKEKIDDSTSSEGLSTNLPPAIGTSGVLGKLFDYSPIGMMSNALGLTTSESDKEKQRKAGNLDYTDKLDTIISLMGGKEISTKKGGYFGVGAEGDMPGDFNKGKSLLDYKDFDDFEANAPEALKSEHFDIMDNEDFNLSKRKSKQDAFADAQLAKSKTSNAMDAFVKKNANAGMVASEDKWDLGGENYADPELQKEYEKLSGAKYDAKKEVEAQLKAERNSITGHEDDADDEPWMNKLSRQQKEMEHLGLRRTSGANLNFQMDAQARENLSGGKTSPKRKSKNVIAGAESDKESQPTNKKKKTYKKGEEWRKYRKPARIPGNAFLEQAADKQAKLDYNARGMKDGETRRLVKGKVVGEELTDVEREIAEEMSEFDAQAEGMKSGETRRLVAGEVVGEELTEQQYGAFSASQSMGNPIAPDDLKKMEAYRNKPKPKIISKSKLANNIPDFNEVDSGVPGKGVKTKNLIAGAEKGTPETEWMRSLGLNPEEMVGRSGGLLSGIGSFFTGKSKDGKDESTLFEKVYDKSALGGITNMLGLTTSESDKSKDGKDESTLFEKAYDKSALGGITNMLGLTTSESDKSKDESIPKNDAEQIKLNYKEGSAQEKKASEEIKKLRGENANIDYGDEFGTNIEFKNPEVQKNYDRLLKLEQAGRLQKNQAVDAQAQSMMNESTGMDTDDQLYEKFEGEGRRGDMEIEAFQELRNKMFLENEGISEDETGQNWKNEQLIDDMAENSLKEMLMPEQVQHDVIAGAEKGTETYSKSSVLASQTSAPEDMTSHNGESGKWNQVGDDWIFYSNRTEDFERKKKIPNNVIAGAEKGTPETEFVEKFRNEYGENDKLMGGGLMSRIGSFFTGKSEDGKDKSTLFEKAYDNSMLGGITNFLGLTTSESDKEKSITEEGQSTDTDSVAPLNDSVTGKLTDQEYLDDIQSYKDRIMSWGKGDMTDLVTMNDGTIIDYSYWRGQKYKWHDGDLTEMYKKLKSGQEIKIGMNAIPKDDEHLNPFNPSFYTDKKMNNTSNILASNIKVGNEMPQVIPNKENVQRKSNLVSSALQKGMDNKIAGTQSQNNGSSSSQTNISAPTINNNTTIKKEGTHDTDVTTRGLNKSAMMSLNDDF